MTAERDLNSTWAMERLDSQPFGATYGATYVEQKLRSEGFRVDIESLSSC